MTKSGELSSGGFSLKLILQKHEEQLMDFEQNICLLCKRKFRDGDQIKRHRSLSKLHTSRLKRLRQRLFSEDQLDRIERKERETLYRDRAKERRLKYGQADRVATIEPSYLGPSDPVLMKPTLKSEPEPIGRDNKGAALMTKMGWREGIGLGKSNEGITDIIKLESQVGTSGLGSKVHKVDPNLSYKEAVKKIMYERYYEISSEEEKD